MCPACSGEMHWTDEAVCSACRERLVRADGKTRAAHLTHAGQPASYARCPVCFASFPQFERLILHLIARFERGDQADQEVAA
jgi:predicted amidophosphoribosyltransferase